MFARKSRPNSRERKHAEPLAESDSMWQLNPKRQSPPLFMKWMKLRQEPARVATIDVAARAERPATEFERAKVWHETYQLVGAGS